MPLYIFDINIVWDVRIYLIFDLINANKMQSLCMLDFANSTFATKTWYCFISCKFNVEKVDNLQKFRSWRKSGIQYIGKEKLVFVKKVLVPIKVVRVKNYDFLHPNFKLHRYHQMNKFLCWCSFYWNNIGTYISHELIVRLMPTWIWYDLLSESQIWPSHHELSHFF